MSLEEMWPKKMPNIVLHTTPINLMDDAVA